MLKSNSRKAQGTSLSLRSTCGDIWTTLRRSRMHVLTMNTEHEDNHTTCRERGAGVVNLSMGMLKPRLDGWIPPSDLPNRSIGIGRMAILFVMSNCFGFWRALRVACLGPQLVFGWGACALTARPVGSASRLVCLSTAGRFPCISTDVCGDFAMLTNRSLLATSRLDLGAMATCVLHEWVEAAGEPNTFERHI